MKLKTIIGGIVVLVAGFGGVAMAAGSYSPPERIHCELSPAGNLKCSDFNRQYLVEATHTADLETGKDIVLTFASGSAFTSSTNEWVVYYTYKTPDNKNVRLKTTLTSIKPDLANGAWQPVKDFYTCSAGYMSCPLSSLPSRA